MAGENKKNADNLLDIYIKLEDLRGKTAACSKSLLEIISRGEILDKNLLQNMEKFAHDIGKTQDALLQTMEKAGVVYSDSMSTIKENINKWIDEKTIRNVKNILKEIGRLNYIGTEEAILTQLEGIKSEAAEILCDIGNYQKYQERIKILTMLLSSAKIENDVPFDIINSVNNAFGFGISYAIMNHQIKVKTEAKIDGKDDSTDSMGESNQYENLSTKDIQTETGKTLIGAVPAIKPGNNNSKIKNTGINETAKEHLSYEKAHKNQDANPIVNKDGSLESGPSSAAPEPESEGNKPVKEKQADFTDAKDVKLARENEKKTNTGSENIASLTDKDSEEDVSENIEYPEGYISFDDSEIVLDYQEMKHKYITSGSKFIADLKKMNNLYPYAISILREVLASKVINLKYPLGYLQASGADTTLIESVCEKLYKMGCLARCVIHQEPVYVASPTFFRVVSNQLVKKIILKENFNNKIEQIANLDIYKPCARIIKAEHFWLKVMRRSNLSVSVDLTLHCPFVRRMLIKPGDSHTSTNILLFAPAYTRREKIDDIQNTVKTIQSFKDSFDYKIIIIDSKKEMAAWNLFMNYLQISDYFFLLTDSENHEMNLLTPKGDKYSVDQLIASRNQKVKVEKLSEERILNSHSETNHPKAVEPAIDQKKRSIEIPVKKGKTTTKINQNNLMDLTKTKKSIETGIKHTKTVKGKKLVRSSHAEIIAKLAGDSKGKESPAEIIRLVADQMKKHHIAESMVLLYGVYQKNKDKWISDLLAEVSYVLRDPLYNRFFSNRDVYNYWDSLVEIPEGDSGNARDYLNCAAMVRCFFKPDLSNDSWHWQVDNRLKQINNDSDNLALEKLPNLKKLINLFGNFLKKNKQGLGTCLEGAGITDQEKLRNSLAGFINKIHDQKQKDENNVRINHRHPRVQATYEGLFGAQSDIAKCFANLNDVKSILAFCSNFTDLPEDKFKTISAIDFPNRISQDKVEQYIEDCWSRNKGAHKRNEPLYGIERSKIDNLLIDTIELLGKYALTAEKLNQLGNAVINKDVVKKQADEANEICTALISEMEGIKTDNFTEIVSICALRYLVKSLIKTFTPGYEKQMNFYEPFLLTNWIELDENYYPNLSFNFNISGLSLFDRCKKHIEQVEQEHLAPDNEETLRIVCNRALSSRNIGTYKLLLKKINTDEQSVLSPVSSKEMVELGQKFINDELGDFRSNLELAYNYGQIVEKDQMDSYMEIANRLADHLKKSQNYGLITLFNDACQKRILLDSTSRRKDLQNQFEILKKKLSSDQEESDSVENYPIIKQIDECLQENNLSVAEDYIHQCRDGNKTEISQKVVSYPNEFMSFLESYQPYYDVCSQNKKYVLKQVFERWTLKQGKDMKSLTRNNRGTEQIAFVDAWTKFSSQSRDAGLSDFLSHLGFPEITSENVDRQRANRIVYHVHFKKNNGLGDVRPNNHSFVKFGSGIYSKGLRLIAMSGQRSPDNILQELEEAKIESDIGTICIYDAAMTVAERRELAKLMKTNENMVNIIVIDRVMALYLTKFERLVRNNKMIELSMPFGNAQPFIPSGFIPPEMFIGRTGELAKIRNMDGPTLVYGGRQLGKSILLKQVSYLEHHPQKGMYAFYFDIKGRKYSEALEEITRELVRNGLFTKKTNDWNQFSNQMKDILSGNSNVDISKIFLLIDEADQFLQSAVEVKNKPIEILREMHNYAPDKFRFVLAGLHNVVKFDKNQLGGNSVYGQLEHLNIKPFNFADACELLLKPLSYLGFTIPSTKIVSTILSKTNYFPGLIQFYGAKLVESVKESYRKNEFDVAKNPPFELDENYLKILLEDKYFLEQIENKFQITLRVDKDDDNYYYIIALMMAERYALDDGQPKRSYKPKDIQEIGEIEDISKITNLKIETLEALMDEMQELNIFSKDADGGYLFNRYSFYSMMGGEQKIEQELESFAD